GRRCTSPATRCRPQARARPPLERRPYPWVTSAPMNVKRVGIVGSGIMGSGIAEVAAKSGHEVVLRSRKQETADKMVAGLEMSLTKQVDKGKLSDEDRQGTLQRVTATSDLGDLAACDLVIESIVEDLATKKHLFNDLDRICGDSTIIATTTST